MYVFVLKLGTFADTLSQQEREREKSVQCVPSNNGQTFLQHVIPPSLVNCPKAVSKKNTGIPQQIKKIT